jgi:hypothetical protein
MIFWFGPQNQIGYGLSVVPKNRRKGDGVGHASRFSGLLHMEASRGRVFQSGLKTGRGTTTDDARGTIAEVASSCSQRRMGRCDELRQTLLPLFYRFHSIRP